MIGHLLNRTLEVWRPSTETDDVGGQTVTRFQVGTVRAKVDQPTAEERQLAGRWDSEHTHTVYMLVTANVSRGDELRGDGQVFRVLAVLKPSRATYRKAPVELIQPEGA